LPDGDLSQRWPDPSNFLQPAAVPDSPSAQFPYAVDFLRSDRGPLRAVTTRADRARAEVKIIDLTFARQNYHFPIRSERDAQLAYDLVLRYLRQFNYYAHKILFEEERMFCEIEFGSIHKTTRDLARDFAAFEPPMGNRGSESQLAEVARRLASVASLRPEDARSIVAAVASKPDEMVQASQKLLKPPTRFVSRKDITDADLNDPAILRAHIDFANQHKNSDIATLDPDTANKLRKARLVRKYDIERRHMANPNPYKFLTDM
jgi:hypothetical protein